MHSEIILRKRELAEGFWGVRRNKKRQRIREIAQVALIHNDNLLPHVEALPEKAAARSGGRTLRGLVPAAWCHLCVYSPATQHGTWPIGTRMRSWLLWCGEVQRSLSWYAHRYSARDFGGIAGKGSTGYSNQAEAVLHRHRPDAVRSPQFCVAGRK